MKHALFLFLTLAFGSMLCAQEPAKDKSQIQAALKVRSLVEKKSEYHRKTNGEYEGYRIKIHFSADRAGAAAVKNRFVARFDGMVPYEDYQQPYFVITVGDFRTKLEAFEALKRIQGEFPNAFIIKSKIRPMKV